MMKRSIRTLTLAEVKQVLGWAAQEGWNPGIADAEAFYAVDPEGFIGAFVGDVMCAAIAAVAYDDAFGFIGLYICHPDWRGQGHGKAVWSAGMAHLGQRCIGLDAVPEQRNNYARAGFVPAYDTIRMTGTVPQSIIVATKIVPNDLAEVSTLDRHYFPAAREGFLWHWLSAPNRAFGMRENGILCGYGAVRSCVVGHKIGPLFAADPMGAITLLQALCAGLDGQVQIDVPITQSAFIDYLNTIDFTPSFSTTRMYRGIAPKFSESGVFGVTSLELG